MWNTEDLSFSFAPRPEGTLDNFMKWKDTLKSLNPDRYREFGHLHTLLENHVFPCLTDLSIGCSQDRKTSPNIRECISHAPSLVSLRVSYRTLTIDDIEIIHYSCPQLSTFEITYSVVSVAKEETLLQEMKAASTVTRLSIDDASIVDESCLFLEYMTQKYTNLIDLCFQPNFRDSLLNLHFPNQTREEQQNNPEFNTIFSQACNTVNAYEDRGSGILSNLPATLQKLSIDSFNPKNAMTILSPKFSNLEHVDFFQYYGINTDEFKQADSIDALKYLTKLKSFNAVLDPSIHKYNHEGPLSTSVTDLNVRIKGKSSQNDMDIGWLFAKFLSINELCILWSGARLIGYKSATSRICPNLTVLRLEHIVAHPKLLHFICNHAPNLKQLYWALWGKKVQENLPEKIQVELPQPTKVKKSVSYYDIDLTGFSLDCFHLHVDLLENTSAKIENLCLSLKKKGGDQLKFIVPSDYECILPKDCSLFPKSTFSAKTNIKIKYGYTKMISINSNAKIDLSDSKIVLDYSDWYF